MKMETSLEAVSSHELGEDCPRPARVSRYAEVLDFPEGFFFENQPVYIELEGITYRSDSGRFTKDRRHDHLEDRNRNAAQDDGYRARGRVEAAGYILASLVFPVLSEYMPLPQVRLPRYPGLDPHNVARALRLSWDIHPGYIPSILDLLEMHGIRVSYIEEPHSQANAFSFWYGDTPFIIVCGSHRTKERNRWTLAHELGHLLLHRDGLSNRSESEANEFAAEFLMPRDEVQEVWLLSNLMDTPYSRTKIDNHFYNIRQIKSQWGVSFRATLERCADLGRISPYVKRIIETRLKRLYGVTGEPQPSDDKSDLESAFIESLLARVASTGISIKDLARRMQITVDELSALLPAVNIYREIEWRDI